VDRNSVGKFIKGHKNFKKFKYVGCKVLGCNSPHKCHGYCSLHYQRWYIYGNAEEPYHWLGRPYSGKDFICIICKKKFYRPPSSFKKAKHQYCSRECGYLANKGVLKNITPIENRKWFKSAKGYLATTIRGKWLWQHRWVIENHIGRTLKKEEIIHHLNGIKNDNRIENLAICSDKSHYKFIKKLQERIKELESKL
jgi:hypothetical protein